MHSCSNVNSDEELSCYYTSSPFSNLCKVIVHSCSHLNSYSAYGVAVSLPAVAAYRMSSIDVAPVIKQAKVLIYLPKQPGDLVEDHAGSNGCRYAISRLVHAFDLCLMLK